MDEWVVVGVGEKVGIRILERRVFIFEDVLGRESCCFRERLGF